MHIRLVTEIRMSIYIYMGLWWPPAASYNCAQVRHHSPAGTFTRVPGRCLRWSPTSQGPRWPPANICILIEVLHLYRCVTHTHTHIYICYIYIYIYVCVLYIYIYAYIMHIYILYICYIYIYIYRASHPGGYNRQVGPESPSWPWRNPPWIPGFLGISDPKNHGCHCKNHGRSDGTYLHGCHSTGKTW